MNIILWILQVLLGLAYTYFAYAHSFGAAETQLRPQTEWIGAVPQPLMLFIALCEFLGGVGLILPWATKIQPRLTPWAGALLAVMMVLAAGFHLVRGEYPNIVINLVLGGLAAFVAYGRFKSA